MLTKSPHIGSSILEIAKERMYSLYYDYLLDTLGGEEHVEVICGDTDSVMIRTSGVHNKDYYLEKLCKTGIMDTSNFSPKDKLFSEKNCRVPGTLKEETGNMEEIEQIISLNAKVYVIKPFPKNNPDGTVTQPPNTYRGKGVPRKVLYEKGFEAYKRCLEETKNEHATFPRMNMKKGVVRNETVSKICLTSMDLKRYWLCYKHRYVYFHFLEKQF